MMTQWRMASGCPGSSGGLGHIVRTPVRAQRANAIAEHWIGSLLRECLDHLLIIGPRHLAAVLQEAPGPGPRSSGAV
jgi:hypothetical protein